MIVEVEVVVTRSVDVGTVYRANTQYGPGLKFSNFPNRFVDARVSNTELERRSTRRTADVEWLAIHSAALEFRMSL